VNQHMNGGLDRITSDPRVMGGRACIRGVRITVALVANGMTPETIQEEYPLLESEDIRQALQYAAALANEELSAERGQLLRFLANMQTRHPQGTMA
jgi:uncharacterized protein (DUF433 family)